MPNLATSKITPQTEFLIMFGVSDGDEHLKGVGPPLVKRGGTLSGFH